MMTTERKDVSTEIENLVIHGDLSRLSSHDRVTYYKKVCDTLGLNPFTKPFDYITLQGKMTLYARKEATEQLRKIHNISLQISSRELVDDVYTVTAQASANGRTDESIGAVSLSGLKGETKANAMMKCESKAKRRVTLSICGLGMLDEMEVSTIPDAKVENINVETGEIERVEATKKPNVANNILKKIESKKAGNDIEPSSLDELIEYVGVLCCHAEEIREGVFKYLEKLSLQKVEELSMPQIQKLISRIEEKFPESKALGSEYFLGGKSND